MFVSLSILSPLLILKKVKIETATKIDEKVPINTPQIIAREKSDKTAPPKEKIINALELHTHAYM